MQSVFFASPPTAFGQFPQVILSLFCYSFPFLRRRISVVARHNLEPLLPHLIINSFSIIYNETPPNKSPIEETISQSISQKRRTFSKKRGRFSKKRWTFSEKRWTFFQKRGSFFLDSPTFLSTLSLALVLKHKKRQGFLPIGRKLCLQFVLIFSSVLSKIKLVLGMLARCTSPFVQLTLLLLQLLPSGLVHLLLQAHNEFVEQRENL